jgi:hypothetical protein
MLEYCWENFRPHWRQGGLPRKYSGPIIEEPFAVREFENMSGENSASDVTMSISYASLWVEMSLSCLYRKAMIIVGWS